MSSYSLPTMFDPSLELSPGNSEELYTEFRDPQIQLMTPIQMSTPVPSTSSTPNENVVSLSTVFYPGAHSIASDTIFLSSDSVYFYVHSHVLLGAAEHAFRPILSAPLSDPMYRAATIHVDETSEVLNVILHALYGMSPEQNSPSFDTVVAAVDRMSLYEINPRHYIIPSNPLRALLLRFAPLHPLETYALAARYDIHDVAESTSSHLLSYALDTISDEMATRMGAVYLNRLLCLHTTRFSALKRIVLVPPFPHLPTPACGFDDQQKLTRAWALAASYLAWDAQPGLSVHSMQAVFAPLHDRLSCTQCQQSLTARIKDATKQWSVVKRTI